MSEKLKWSFSSCYIEMESDKILKLKFLTAFDRK
jgi:hypothetical protein